jgi:hypothetical protein
MKRILKTGAIAFALYFSALVLTKLPSAIKEVREQQRAHKELDAKLAAAHEQRMQQIKEWDPMKELIERNPWLTTGFLKNP